MIYFVFSVLLGALGHVFAKIGSNSRGFILFNINTIIAIAFYGISFLLWIYFLKGKPLAVVVPLNSLTYVVVAILSYFIFNEKLNVIQYIGIGTIVLGVYLLER
jgi:drug/metabolite transporter (DMT)-like permease